MEFNKPVTQIIKERRSCRSFDPKKTDEEALKKLEEYIVEINRQAKTKARFILTGKQSTGSASPAKLGTYGIINGANQFIIGIAAKGETDEAEFGYLFEKIVLCATDLGLGTCWLGGTFKREDFIHKASLTGNEFIPIVSPVGIKTEKMRLLDKAMRAGAGSNRRRPWDELFFDADATTPLMQQKAKTALEMVRLAPSASNKQPWRIICDSSGYHFFIQRTKGYGPANFDIQKNDVGIAMCHFELTAKECGLGGEWNKSLTVSAPDEWVYVQSWLASKL